MSANSTVAGDPFIEAGGVLAALLGEDFDQAILDLDLDIDVTAPQASVSTTPAPAITIATHC